MSRRQAASWLAGFPVTGADSALGQKPGRVGRCRDRCRDYGLVALIADSGSQNKAVTAAVIAVWAILAAACLGTAAVRWYRSRNTNESTDG